jgi:hypothetical protein
MNFKNSFTSSGLEPSTLLFSVQCDQTDLPYIFLFEDMSDGCDYELAELHAGYFLVFDPKDGGCR